MTSPLTGTSTGTGTGTGTEYRTFHETAASLLEQYAIGERELSLIREIGSFVAPRMDQYVDQFYAWMRTLPEFTEYFTDARRLERVQHEQVSYWREMFRGVIDDAYISRRRMTGEAHARIGLSLPVYFAAVDHSLTILVDRLLGADELADRRVDAVRAMTKLVHLDAAVVVQSYARLTSEKLTGQAQALMEMSTPVTALWENVLLLPVVGIIDSRRAQDIMTSVLSRIADTRARAFIIDISGVPIVDTAVANHLFKIGRATRLMGCECLMSGVSPAVAQTMVELGVDVGDMRTRATLRDALEDAFRRVGIEVRKIER